MSHPDGLPDLFIDRSLGRILVPTILRAAGLRLETLAERYGIPADESVSDERWLREAGERGEAVFMKDTRVRYHAAERAALVAYSVRCFCLTRGDLSGAEMAHRFLDNLAAITRACGRPGPSLFAVHRERIEPLVLG